MSTHHFAPSPKQTDSLWEDLCAARKSVESLGLENTRLRILCRELEIARDERDGYLRDLEDIGRTLGCNHIGDGLARCVRAKQEDAHALRGAIIDHCHRLQSLVAYINDGDKDNAQRVLEEAMGALREATQ